MRPFGVLKLLHCARSADRVATSFDSRLLRKAVESGPVLSRAARCISGTMQHSAAAEGVAGALPWAASREVQAGFMAMAGSVVFRAL